jgi:hypothetical protein
MERGESTAMIVVEGMDNSGKSTLCEQLGKHFGFPVEHSPSKLAIVDPNSWRKWLSEAIEKATTDREHHIIYDRFPITSESVYGPVLRNNNLLYSEPSLILKWISTNPILVYCRPPREIILHFGDGVQMPGVKEHADELLNAYDLIIETLGRSVFTFKYDFHTTNQLDSLITRIAHVIRI